MRKDLDDLISQMTVLICILKYAQMNNLLPYGKQLFYYIWFTIIVSSIQHSYSIFFIDYTPFKVIIKYWLPSLCYTIYPYILFILYVVVCTS